VPRVFLSLVSEGPLAADMTWMQALLQNPKESQIVVTALPEEMPVNEAIELRTALLKEKLPVSTVVLNSVFTPRFTDKERIAVAQGGPMLAAVADAADGHEARAQMSVQYEKVLRDAVGQPVLVPQIFDRVFGAAAIEQVAAALAGVL